MSVTATVDDAIQQPASRTVRPWSGIQYFLSLLPGLWVALFYGFAAKTALRIGHWPRPGEFTGVRQDPLHWPIMELLWPGLGIAAMLSVPLWLGMMIWRWGRFSAPQKRVFVALYALGWVSVGVLFLIDPGGTYSWWFD